MHTNFDIAKMADLNAADLQLTDPRILDVTGEDAAGNPIGLGRVGEVPEMKLGDFAEVVKSAMALDAVRVYGDPDRIIKICAVSSGSGKSEIPAAIAAGADVLVTGDLDYHTSIDANAQGLALIDAGHYGTEFVYITYMEDYLKKTFPELSVRSMKIKQPYSVL
jgi:putative NIF3 family GTP cyclohydrolase 1 type 2